jgi:type II secretory pathway component PulJ
MKTLPHPPIIPKRRPTAAFTLTETVIAIGVLAVLLTGFIAVFTPAAQGIRRSISSEQADRLTSTLEAELVTPRQDQPPATNQSNPSTAITGFRKAFDWIRTGNTAATAIFVYQYRGNPNINRRKDGTMVPVPRLTNAVPGKTYILQTMARRANDTTLLEQDLEAVEGSVFFVRPIQMVFNAGALQIDATPTLGKLKNPVPLPVRTPNPYPTEPDKAEDFADAVLPFSAEFHSVPSKTFEYLTGAAFKTRHARIIAPNSPIKPVFTRNLAVRR